MKLRLPILCVVISVGAIALSSVVAQSQQTNPPTPTIKVTSALVFLDVTVLDKKGPSRSERVDQRRLHYNRGQNTADHLLL